MAEIESVSARKATLLNPTEADETVQVLRRRLFEYIDGDRAAAVVDAYRELWAGNRDALGAAAARPETVEQFRASYLVHPHVLETLTGKTATLPAGAPDVAAACSYRQASLAAAARARDGDSPSPCRSRLRADPAGDRDPSRPGCLRDGNHQRRGRRIGRAAVAGQRTSTHSSIRGCRPTRPTSHRRSSCTRWRSMTR